MIRYLGKRLEADEKSSNQTAWNYGTEGDKASDEIWGQNHDSQGGDSESRNKTEWPGQMYINIKYLKLKWRESQLLNHWQFHCIEDTNEKVTSRIRIRCRQTAFLTGDTRWSLLNKQAQLTHRLHTKYSENVQWMHMYSSNNHEQEISSWTTEDMTLKHLRKFLRFSWQMLIRCWSYFVFLQSIVVQKHFLGARHLMNISELLMTYFLPDYTRRNIRRNIYTWHQLTFGTVRPVY